MRAGQMVHEKGAYALSFTAGFIGLDKYFLAETGFFDGTFKKCAVVDADVQFLARICDTVRPPLPN